MILVWILLVGHLTAGAWASCGPIGGALGEWLGRRNTQQRDDYTARITRQSLVALIVAVLCGLALWGIQLHSPRNQEAAEYGRRLQSLMLEQSWSFWGELAFTAVAYLFACRWSSGEYSPWRRRTALLLGGTNLLYHLPMRMTVLRFLVIDPQFINVPWTRATKYAVLSRAECQASLLHTWGAMIGATACLFIMHRNRQSTTTNSTSWSVITLLLAVFAQLCTGVWQMLLYPTERRDIYFGEQPIPTVCLGIAIITSVVCLALTSIILSGDGTQPDKEHRTARWAVATFALAGLSMIAATVWRY